MFETDAYKDDDPYKDKEEPEQTHKEE